jgi:hypothetical protein
MTYHRLAVIRKEFRLKRFLLVFSILLLPIGAPADQNTNSEAGVDSGAPAHTSPDTAGLAGPGESTPVPNANQQMNAQILEERKQQILQRMNERLEKLQNAKDCVEAAQNPQALHQCMPHQGRGGPHSRQGGRTGN